jgi:AbrB family looped-hinge helix DNA binding protein
MSKVTAKYQITIPPEVRKQLGIFPGMEVAITQKGEAFELVVDPVEALKRKWRGKLKGGLTSDQYLDEVRGRV